MWLLLSVFVTFCFVLLVFFLMVVKFVNMYTFLAVSSDLTVALAPIQTMEELKPPDQASNKRPSTSETVASGVSHTTMVRVRVKVRFRILKRSKQLFEMIRLKS